MTKTPADFMYGMTTTRNPDLPRIHPSHRAFLAYLWMHGGPMQRIDEYTVQVEVDPQFGVGRDSYAKVSGVSPKTVGRWASALKAHGLLATRKTKARDWNPMGRGRTIWIVRVPIKAITTWRRYLRTRAAMNESSTQETP